MTQSTGDTRNWWVTAQVRSAAQVPGGSVARGWELSWATKDGGVGTTFVPDTDASNPDKLVAAVQADYDAYELRRGLSG